MPSRCRSRNRERSNSAKGPHDGEHEVGHGGVLAGEDQTLFDELHPRTFACEALDESTQVIEVAGEPVHAVHDDGVPVTGEPQQLSKLRPGRVPARGFVHEDPVQNLAFELAFLVLVQRADPHVPDPLSSHLSLQTLNLSD
jgi:hypothetical protein